MDTLSHLMDTLSHLKESFSRGTKLVGSFCYWQGLKNARITRDDFAAGMLRAGFGAALAETPKPEASLRFAIAAARKELGSGNIDVALKSKGARAVYAVQMKREIAGRIDDREEAEISVARDGSERTPTMVTHADVVDDEMRTQFASLVAAAYVDHRAWMSSLEMSGALVRSMELVESISLRDGVFLVPAAYAAQIESLGQFVEHGLANVSWTAWSIMDAGENLAQARRDARKTFFDQLRGLAQNVAAFTAKTPPADADARSVAAHVLAFQQLSATVELWADVLGDAQRELTSAITVARDTMLASYLGDETTDAAA